MRGAMPRPHFSTGPRLPRGLARAALVAAAVATGCAPALAYRPFDGTDAAVADVGELEIEMQPAGVLRHSTGKILKAPETVLNFGIVKQWELVLEGQLDTPFAPGGPSSLSESGVFLKHVLREGSLQDKTGPSVATEFGVLLPDLPSDQRVGASIAAIVSQRWDWGTIHLNASAALTRDQNADYFLDAIIEGPAKWKVRPVAEFFYEDEIGAARTLSALVGAIWQVRDNLSFDVGVRHALRAGHPVDELRAGFTIGFPLNFLGGPGRK